MPPADATGQESGRPLHDGALLLQRPARTRRRAPDRRGRSARSRRPLRRPSAAGSILPIAVRRSRHQGAAGADLARLDRRGRGGEAAARGRLRRDAETVDVALATNMISVGLDITRLGLMVVQGQPKTAAEYIQATSRVGRDHSRPGLVLAVLNVHKPRDRMHYEQFGQFHRTFYRAVEATSVTPWAARALDRALAAVVVAAARHVDASADARMSPSTS